MAKRKSKNGEPRRFLDSALKSETDKCIIWPFGFASNGYGAIYARGQMRSAHREICREAHGEPTSKDLDAAHSCGVKGCVNPRHLRWATKRENAADRIEHGTHSGGAANPQSKLTNEAVKEIRRPQGRVRQVDLASRYGVTRSAISYAQSGHTWKDGASE
ncbi:MAG: HNH endonuclease [Pseudomonadota bacterium]